MRCRPRSTGCWRASDRYTLQVIEIPASTIDWLLDADPSIRWQVMRDLKQSPAKQVREERALVAGEGWGKRLLELQADDGNWGGGPYTPKWISTMYTLLLLRHVGIEPGDERTRNAIGLVEDKVTLGGRNRPFFDYSTEVCMTGMALALSSYFGVDVDDRPQPEYLLERRRGDGGWNCHVSSDRSSFHTTISVLEGLLEYERAIGGDSDLARAREHGHEYLLKRRLMYSLSTGELVSKKWLLLAFPPRWFYDILRALDYFRDAGIDPDPRMDEAVEVVMSKQRKDGTWPLQGNHPGKVHFEMEEGSGQPSRWNTLRVLRVMQWHGG